MKRALKIIGGAFLALVCGYVVLYYVTIPGYSYKEKTLPVTFDEFFAAKIQRSKELKARPGNEEKLIRFSKDRTKLAFLYIHGFGASRAEGEEIVDRLANRFKANTYYLRLPGHGTNKEDFVNTGFSAYIDEVEDTVRMMPLLGEKVIVIGTSMGGLLGTYAASRHPDKITALILCSPFFDFAEAAPKLFEYPGGIHVVHLLMGKIRNSVKGPDDVEGYQGYWYPQRYFRSYLHIADLKKAIARDEIYRKVTVPVQMVYYYRDKEKQDKTASVKAMQHAFASFGKDVKPNPLNRSVAIKDGAHVLFSKWVISDKDTIEKAVADYIDQFLK